MNIALLIAGGSGARMHQNIPKQFLTVNERPVIVYTLEAFQHHPEIDEIAVVCIEGWESVLWAYELVVNDKVQRENINSINYFRDDKLVQQAISDMEKLMAARQQSKEQERGSTKKSVLDALRSLKAKKQEQPAQEQPIPQKSKKRGDIEL